MLDLGEEVGQGAGNGGIGLGGSPPVEHHQSEGVWAVGKKVHQRVLVDPEGLPHESLNPVARRLRPDVPAGREAYLKRARSSGLHGRSHPVASDEGPDAGDPYVLPLAVEERADEALPLETAGARERVPAGGVGGVRQR